MSTAELAVVYAALILQDGAVEITVRSSIDITTIPKKKTKFRKLQNSTHRATLFWNSKKETI